MRQLEAGETADVWEGLDAWGRGVGDKVVDNGLLWEHEGEIRLTKGHLPDPRSENWVGGLVIGRLTDNGFILGLQGAVLVSHHSRVGRIRVNDKATAAFLYGKNILKESVLAHDPKLRKGDACIVCNPRNEAIGVGVVVGTFKGRGELVHPLHELGTYLRDQ